MNSVFKIQVKVWPDVSQHSQMAASVQRTLGVVRGGNSVAEYLPCMCEVLSSTNPIYPRGEPGDFALFLPMISVSTG